MNPMFDILLPSRRRLVPLTSRPKPLSPQWCTRHWEPYHRLPEEPRKWASIALWREMTGFQRFRQAFEALQEARPHADFQAIAQQVCLMMVATSKKPLCCILGDPIMAKIFAEATDESLRKVRHDLDVA